MITWPQVLWNPPLGVGFMFCTILQTFKVKKLLRGAQIKPRALDDGFLGVAMAAAAEASAVEFRSDRWEVGWAQLTSKLLWGWEAQAAGVSSSFISSSFVSVYFYSVTFDSNLLFTLKTQQSRCVFFPPQVCAGLWCLWCFTADPIHQSWTM